MEKGYEAGIQTKAEVELAEFKRKLWDAIEDMHGGDVESASRAMGVPVWVINYYTADRVPIPRRDQEKYQEYIDKWEKQKEEKSE